MKISPETNPFEESHYLAYLAYLRLYYQCNETDIKEILDILAKSELDGAALLEASSAIRSEVLDSLVKARKISISESFLLKGAFMSVELEDFKRMLFKSKQFLQSERVAAKASDLHKIPALSFLHHPLYCENYDFLGHNGVSSFYSFYQQAKETFQAFSTGHSPLRSEQQSIVETLTTFQSALMNWRESSSYDVPSPMTEITTANQVNMMEHVITPLSNKIAQDNPSVQPLTGSQSAQLDLCYASTRSIGQEAIAFQKGRESIFVMGVEWKGSESLRVVLPQAVQCGCDIITHLVGKLRLDPSNTVVPVFCVDGEGISIQLIYAMRPCYPVPLTISRQLVPSSPKDLAEISFWMYAVVRNAAALFAAYDRAAGFAVSKPSPEIVRNGKLSMNGIFLKPIQVVDGNCMAFKM
jgi:hypothetical protein